MRRFLRNLVGVAAALAIASTAQAQWFTAGDVRTAASGYISAVSTVPAVRVIWRGTVLAAGDPTIAVASNSIAFTTDGTTADETLTGCGGTAGTLDATNAACDTYVELINKINSSANWIAVPGDGILGSDTTYIADLSEVKAATAGGITLFDLTSSSLKVGVALNPAGAVTGLGSQLQVVPFDIRFWLSGNKINPNPFADYQSYALAYSEAVTYGSGSSTTKVYGVIPKFTYSATGVPTYSETVRTVWSVPSASTGATATYVASGFPFLSNPGERLLVRVENSVALTAPTLVSYGHILRAVNR